MTNYVGFGLAIFYSPILNAGFNLCLCLATILPVVQKQHQLLVTLLLCNACAMEV